MGDESGTLVRQYAGDDRFFVVATLALSRPNCLPGAMDDLRRECLPYLSRNPPEWFHAKEDTPITRRRLLGLLASHPLGVDVTVIDKHVLSSTIRTVELYSIAWYEHLVHCLPGLLLLPPAKIRLFLARLNDSAHRQGFGLAYNEATMIAYLPFMAWFTRGLVPPSASSSTTAGWKVPALMWGIGEPKQERLLQAADVVAWAARRAVAMGDESYYNIIRGRVRSNRVLVVSECVTHKSIPKYRLGILKFERLRARVHDFHANGWYVAGPADDFQRLIAVEQRVNLGWADDAARFAEHINPHVVEGAGLVGWSNIQRVLCNRN